MKRHWSNCDTCHSTCTLEVDDSGRYLITKPSRCVNKRGCEQQTLRENGYTPIESRQPSPK